MKCDVTIPMLIATVPIVLVMLYQVAKSIIGEDNITSNHYRIIKYKRGKYYVQKQVLWMWFDCLCYDGFDTGTRLFDDKEKAEAYIKEQIRLHNTKDEICS